LNKLVVVLAATTVAGAAAALHYRQQLIEERTRSAAMTMPAPAADPVPARVPAAAPPSPAPTSAPASASRIDSPKPASAPPPASRTADLPPTVVVSDDRKTRNRQQAAEFLTRYEDPSRRGELRAQALDRARKGFEEFAKKQSLDAGQLEKLVAVIADQELERRVAQARCMAEPGCDRPEGWSELVARQKQALIDLVGEDGFRELSDWGASQPDRRMADAFARRLPDSAAWSADHSAALASVLKDGRSAAMREMSSQGQHFKGFGNQEGMTVMYADELPTLEARLASANAYAQRMRGHAATVLSGEQLRLFDQMQEELLSDLARFLRRRDTGKREAG
jgi:hypothetical protein